MKNSILGCLLVFACTGCSKAVDQLAETVISNPSEKTVAVTETILYTIKKGAHNCDGNTLKWLDTSALRFSVRFDSSAVYTAQQAENQWDINKLYGFSDNGAQHHLFSARFGWRWSDGALRLFAYVYNNGTRQEKELGTVPIGLWSNCSIEVSRDRYIFTLNEKQVEMPRASTTAKATGYLLYPYFGGNEVAPHDVRIEIRNR